MTTQQSSSRLRIAFLTLLDPHDKRSWSTGLYYMRRALQQHCGDVTCLGPISFPEPTFLSRIRSKASRMLFKKRFLHWMCLATARHNGLEAMQKLAGQTFDVIVAMASGAAVPYLETNIPIVLAGDATFAQLIDYHPYYTHLSRRSKHEIYAIEQQVFKKVRASLMSSEWAARSVIQDYQVAPSHVYNISFGANLDTFPAREITDARKLSERCRLLFVGVDWQRKGGDIAYETLLKLHEMGVDSELIVCGSTPPPGIAHERLTVIPFLDKNDVRQAREIEKLYIMSDFLILPTRADCAPFVFSEANAYGLPVITTDTGGIASLIFNGGNGYMLPLAARGSEYADLIANIYHDKQRYLRLAQSSRAAFEERLNWDAWGRSVHDILVKVRARVELTGIMTYAKTQ